MPDSRSTTPWHSRANRGRVKTALAALLICGATAISTSVPAIAQAQVPGHASAHVPPARQAASSAFDWPELHQGPGLQGYAANGTVTTANAAHLGVDWATDLYGPALDSPVAAYDSTLNETLTYVATEEGDFLAINVANGQIVWSVWLGPGVRSTPVVNNGSVYVATLNSSRIYRLNATTGATQCSVAAPHEVESSGVVATPPGGVTSLYYGTLDTATSLGPTIAVNASTCAIEWQFKSFKNIAGAWDPISYAVEASGEPLVLFGTADSDAGIYALDAVTGQEVWRFQAANPPPSVYDIGAGVTVSPPGAITADGVAFVPSKYGIMYALDLSTGAQIWSYNFDSALKLPLSTSLSTAALDGGNLVFGDAKGLLDVNAATGKLIWSYTDPENDESLSSPAISGPAGSEVAVTGDIGGGFNVVSLATGAQLFHYLTGGYITASPAVSGGNILIASSDGFLYDFAAGQTLPATAPTTAITSPSDSATVANPASGNLTVKGTASTSSATTVAGADVAVQSGGPDGQWWDAASGAWNSGPVNNPATLASSGTYSSGWSFSYPVPPGGGTYRVIAYTLSAAGQPDTKGAQAGFAVLPSTTGPNLETATGFAAPASSTAVTGSGFGDKATVTIALEGTTLATVTSTATGALPAGTTVTIPGNAPFGQASLTAAAGTTGPTASAAITIANNWDELGYDAGHDGTETNDTTLDQLISPGGGVFLDPAWRYQTSAAIDTAPAVADDVAYAANNAGQLTAVDVHNGAARWTWTLPSGAAIGGSPAVDPALGLVFAGADDGTLDAIATATGTLSWSATAGGSGTDVSAPVYGGGDIYVTTDTTSGSATASTVQAYSESSGTKLWSVTGLAGPLTAPALDAAGGTLAVGGPAGLTALSTSTGATRWTYTTGAVTAPPAISGGSVYFGSANDDVYAVSESAGSRTWSYKTPDAIADTPAVSDEATPGSAPTVFIGSGNSDLYTLNAATGALDFSHRISTTPIVGVAAVDGLVVSVTSAGVTEYCRSYSPVCLQRRVLTKDGDTAPPAIVDGTVYYAAGSGDLYAYSGYGKPPA